MCTGPTHVPRQGSVQGQRSLGIYENSAATDAWNMREMLRKLRGFLKDRELEMEPKGTIGPPLI